MDEPLHPLGLCDLATVGKCPETAPAHPFIFQHNLKILCIRTFCLSKQYSVLSALVVDGVKDSVKQFKGFSHALLFFEIPSEKEDGGCVCHQASETFCFSSRSTDQKEMSHFIISILPPIALFRFAPTSSWTEEKINHTNIPVHRWYNKELKHCSQFAVFYYLKSCVLGVVPGKTPSLSKWSAQAGRGGFWAAQGFLNCADSI